MFNRTFARYFSTLPKPGDAGSFMNRPTATSSSGVTQTIKEEITDITGKTTFINRTVTSVKSTWNDMSPRMKMVLKLYTGCGLFTNLLLTYNDGKHSLQYYRNSKPDGKGERPTGDSYSYKTVKTEWDAVYYGCTHNGMSNFFSSVFWPLHLSANVMPGIILALNKEDDKQKSDSNKKTVL